MLEVWRKLRSASVAGGLTGAPGLEAAFVVQRILGTLCALLYDTERQQKIVIMLSAYRGPFA